MGRVKRKRDDDSAEQRLPKRRGYGGGESGEGGADTGAGAGTGAGAAVGAGVDAAGARNILITVNMRGQHNYEKHYLVPPDSTIRVLTDMICAREPPPYRSDLKFDYFTGRWSRLVGEALDRPVSELIDHDIKVAYTEVDESAFHWTTLRDRPGYCGVDDAGDADDADADADDADDADADADDADADADADAGAGDAYPMYKWIDPNQNSEDILYMQRRAAQPLVAGACAGDGAGAGADADGGAGGGGGCGGDGDNGDDIDDEWVTEIDDNGREYVVFD
jgi:hypothetical protein